MIVTQIAAPEYPPVTLDMVKLHCRGDGTVEDSLLAAFVGAAVGACQHRLGRSLMEQKWRVTVDAFPATIRLPNPEILSLDSIKYRDSAGVQQDLDLSTYELVGDTLHLAEGVQLPDVGSGVGVVNIDYTAGYGTGSEQAQQDAVPDAIKTWILLTVATMYANRESIVVGASVASIQDSFVDRLLDPFKVY
jgi:uncharacterized phiE125 gp8 family phage protein